MSERILIVDDHPLTRDALSSLLGAGGFDVVGEAADGAAALELAQSLQPDLVLLDLSMPGLDGLSALPRLRVGSAGMRGRRAHSVGHRGKPSRRNPGRCRRLSAQERAAGANRCVSARGRERRGRALRRDRAPTARPAREPAAGSVAAFRIESRMPSRPARSRCCCFSTTTFRPTTSPSGSSSRSTPCART